MINRREALNRVGLIVGGTVVGAEVFLSGCTSKTVGSGAALNFDATMLALLDEVGETILPTTAKSGGAKAAGVGQFMKNIVSECYTEKQQQVFANAVPLIEAAARKSHGKDFMSLTAPERHDLIVAIDSEAKRSDSNRDEPEHGFTLLKQLTLWGYFTSEVGCKEALRYNPIPGKQEGCIEYTPGEGAWSAI